MKNDYLPRLEPSSYQCRLQILKPFPCTWLPFLSYLSVHLRFEYASPLYFLTKEQLLPRDESLRYLTLWDLLEGRTRTIQDSDFIGCSRHWVEPAASEGSDDHFTWVLSIFSTEKYRVLPFEKMCFRTTCPAVLCRKI